MNNLRELAGRFNIHNGAENKSEKTLEWYRDSIERFCRFVESFKGSPATLQDLTIEQVEFFIVELQTKPTVIRNTFAPPRKRKLSNYTINAYVRALKAFSHWLYLNGRTRTWTLERIKPPKLERELKNALTPKEWLTSLDPQYAFKKSGETGGWGG